MRHSITGLFLGKAALLLSLSACSQASVNDTPAKAELEKATSYEYVSIENFSHDLAQFVGLAENDSFEVAETKIKAVFKAYDTHADPADISMDSDIVEGGWKQVLVTQNGLVDGIVTGQQLLAIFDDEKKLMTYGMRIKCHSETGNSDWQTTLCE